MALERRKQTEGTDLRGQKAPEALGRRNASRLSLVPSKAAYAPSFLGAHSPAWNERDWLMHRCERRCALDAENVQVPVSAALCQSEIEGWL